MNIPLDENVDRRVRRIFDPEHEVVTVGEQGWSGITNGELLRRAEQQFDVLVTHDGIMYALHALRKVEGRWYRMTR